MKPDNRKDTYDLLREQPGLDAAGVMRELGTSRSTTQRVLDSLVSAGLLTRHHTYTPKGRPTCTYVVRGSVYRHDVMDRRSMRERLYRLREGNAALAARVSDIEGTLLGEIRKLTAVLDEVRHGLAILRGACLPDRVADVERLVGKTPTPTSTPKYTAADPEHPDWRPSADASPVLTLTCTSGVKVLHKRGDRYQWWAANNKRPLADKHQTIADALYVVATHWEALSATVYDAALVDIVQTVLHITVRVDVRPENWAPAPGDKPIVTATCRDGSTKALYQCAFGDIWWAVDTHHRLGSWHPSPHHALTFAQQWSVVSVTCDELLAETVNEMLLSRPPTT